MTLLEGVLGGGLGGLAGAAIGHAGGAAVLGSGLENALRGSYGPPFAALAVHSGLSLGPTAYALRRRPADGLLALLVPALLIALPMAVLTRLGRPLPWVQLVAWCYALALWVTMAALGWRLAGWKGALGGPAGAFAGYLLLSLLPQRGPSLTLSLMDGLFTGAGLGCGIAIASRRTQ